MKIPRFVSLSRFSLVLVCTALCGTSALRAEESWQTLFDGKTLDGWKASEHPASFTVVNGLIRGNGLRSHLFYLGAGGQASFENFELELDVKAMDGANSGVYFHATWQPEGWPRLSGTEVQVNNDQPLFEKNYIENKKTGSLYGFRNLYKAMAKDGEWFTYNIRVTKPRVQVRINGKLMIDYVEPSNVPVLEAGQTRDILTRGTFALQCHDEKSEIFYRNIRVRRLPDGENAAIAKPVYNDQDRRRQVLARDNFPLLDLRTHLSDELTLNQVQELRNRTGIFAGIVYPAGAQGAVHDEATANAVVQALHDEPIFAGLEVSGEQWLTVLTPETRAKFDFIVATPDPTAVTGDERQAMEARVNALIALIERRPIDVLANVMVLPAGFSSSADVLWTEERMQRVIAAAVTHGVAFEINPRQRTPSEAFIKIAKGAGAKFTIGGDRSSVADYADWPYLLEIQPRAGLSWREMWVPGHAPSRAQRALKN